MKIFHLTLQFELMEKPDWFEEFRKKYREVYKYHITLKYPTYVADIDIQKLIKNVQGITETIKPIKIEFDKFFFGKTENGYLIMIHAKNNKSLLKLQKVVTDKLKYFGKSTKESYSGYEKNFKPHIALARNLTKREFDRAKGELPNKVYCLATAGELVLTITGKNYAKKYILDPKY